MKHHLLTGVAVAAALAFSAPVWAQTSPSGGNSMGTPGPNPGGPGLTPYSTPGGAGPNPGGSALSGPRLAPRTAPSAAVAPSATPPSSMSDTSSATPPMHRHARHASHGKMAGHHRGTQVSSSTANQLNQEELARLQSGSTSMPPAPSSAPGMMPPGGARMTPHGTVQ
jgi:hypothetical protein